MQLFFCRSVGADDVYITIMYCGVCYADVHWTRNVTGHSNYPLVPGYGTFPSNLDLDCGCVDGLTHIIFLYLIDMRLLGL